ncbi:glycoside hydrolase family 2 protein [Microcella daejeonensis]|uniref:glycoside hydrolase family 2 protein n=1 Tax=Microcella daejeonensis TaxID=2994971 RepID=UPI0022721803|nr:glycoside hydrolase family 2 protein [Microcella daejeonensis]WAB84994.1 glycoside hydrolase family 2 protein [Microcella daejeonensis]
MIPSTVPDRDSRDITEGWTLELAAGRTVPTELAGRTIPAAVPGTVHTDLLAAGLIPDPYLDDNERLLAWIGSADSVYRTRVALTPTELAHERIDLAFDGLDTIASVRLGGTEVLRTANQHRSYRVDARGAIDAGALAIEVAFSAPVPAADAASLSLGYRPHVNHHPYNALRKMACSFGWDWGIDTATSGIWRPVRVEAWSVARLSELRLSPAVDGADGVVDVVVEVERSGAAGAAESALEVLVSVGGVERSIPIAAGDSTGTARLVVADARLWWPRGYGEQELYDAVVTLVDADGVVRDRRDRRIGFRFVEIDDIADELGTPFVLVVNGQRIVVRGANWIPDDAFPHRVDRARYAERLAQAEFANINLLRVWGGGIYEHDDFFAEADERGILTWQDFLLACAAYSEEEPLRSEIEAEAREAIIRLADHPSLVMMNGNNENIWGYEEWNWQHRLEGRTWGAGYYYDLFPALVSELAPHVRYTPGSPFSPRTVAGDDGPAQNAPDHGTMHIWDLWNEKDYPHYRDYRPRFVAEFGWQAPAAWATIERSIHDEPLTPESPGMIVHQKAIDGNVKLTDGLVAHLPLPNDMRQWHWAMQLNQATAIRTGIEWFRSLTPHCMGTVVWQLNDCWPVTSWSAVDGDGRPKPLLFALRRAHADRLVTIQPEGDALRVAVVNDSVHAVDDEVRIARLAFDGTVIDEWTQRARLPAHDAVSLMVPDALGRPGDRGAELLVAEWGGERALWFFAEYRDSALPAAVIDREIVAAPGEPADRVVVRVTARTLVRDLTLAVDTVHPDARALDGLIDLLSGESVDITVTLPAGTDPAALLDDSVLQTANQLLDARKERDRA